MQIPFAYVPVPESSPKYIHTRAIWGQKTNERVQTREEDEPRGGQRDEREKSCHS